jgi:hypothetical protein
LLVILLLTSFAASSACFGQVGTSNTVTADPPVPHPPTQPEKVQQFTDLQFADFNPKTFQMTPPLGAAHRQGPRSFWWAIFSLRPGASSIALLI